MNVEDTIVDGVDIDLYKLIENTTFVNTLLILCISHFLLYFLIPKIFPHISKDKQNYAAYILSSAYGVVALTYYGYKAWFTEVVDEARTNLYMYLGPITTNVIFMSSAYQLWNLFACLVTKDVRTTTLILHHIFTLFFSVCCCCDKRPLIHYYAVFYVGISELSTSWLVIVDLFNTVPSLKKKYPLIHLIGGIGFTLTYFPTRIFAFMYMNYHIYINTFRYLANGKVHSNFILISFIVANVFVTILQFMWGKVIIDQIIEKFSNKSKNQ